MRELMERKTNKDENPKAAKTKKFATFLLRGFENISHMLAVGSFGDDFADSAKRCDNVRRNTLISDGIKPPYLLSSSRSS